MRHRINDRKYEMWLCLRGGVIVAAAVAFAAFWLGGSPSSAQTGPSNVFSNPGPAPPYGNGSDFGRPIPQPGPGMNPQPGMNPNDPIVKSQIQSSQALGEAIGRFRSAQGDEAKAAAQKTLVEALTKYFDADMKVREAGLQKVEAQVKTLRSQFDKRASKKQEVIDLQLKLLENEADGLGFFGSPPGSLGMPGMPGLPGNSGIMFNWPQTAGPADDARTSNPQFLRREPLRRPSSEATPPVETPPRTFSPNESEQDDASTRRERP